MGQAVHSSTLSVVPVRYKKPLKAKDSHMLTAKARNSFGPPLKWYKYSNNQISEIAHIVKNVFSSERRSPKRQIDCRSPSETSPDRSISQSSINDISEKSRLPRYASKMPKAYTKIYPIQQSTLYHRHSYSWVVECRVPVGQLSQAFARRNQPRDFPLCPCICTHAWTVLSMDTSVLAGSWHSRSKWKEKPRAENLVWIHILYRIRIFKSNCVKVCIEKIKGYEKPVFGRFHVVVLFKASSCSPPVS